jgi:caffeoyl-CoA O-methyltransferase
MDSRAAIENYILDHIDEEDPLLQELSRETHLKLVHYRMISGHLQGMVLTMLSRMIRPKRILEIGTFTGYSAICLAKGLPEGGRLYTIEVDDEVKSLASKYFEKAGLRDKIVQVTGDARKWIPKIEEWFDLVYIDAGKKDYGRYYTLVFDKVVPGGYILADNTLWNEKIFKPSGAHRKKTEGILQFNTMVRNDQRVEKVMLPIRDGLTIIRKKE